MYLFRDFSVLDFKSLFLQTRFEFPADIDDVSEDAQDLIHRLICVPNGRFGKKGLDEFKNHPWFSAIAWENIRDSESIDTYLKCYFQKHIMRRLK